MTLRYSTDIVIFGGGIAGLWLLNRLQNEGYHPLLFENNALGGGQTLASQGIIHGGLKYALGGSLIGAAKVIAGMPQRWRQCLSGKGELDLTGVPVLSEHYYMWSDGSFRSNLKSFLGSKNLVGLIEPVSRENYPRFFCDASIKGTLYQLQDFVIDTAALLEILRKPIAPKLLAIKDENYHFRKESESARYTLVININSTQIAIEAERFVFCAGEGNAHLIEKTSIQSVRAQTRPLHMVYMKQADLPHFFVHCIGDDFSLTPKLTITSHTDHHNETVWYLGGDLAEKGVGKSGEEQILSARHLITKLLPWIDTTAASWSSFKINRAEANVKSKYRPDDAYIATESNIILAWPTKLTLTPSMADKVVNTIQRDSVSTIDNAEALGVLKELLGNPESAPAYWD